MADYHTTETFFRPPEVARLSSTVPAGVSNMARNLLARSREGCVFVPIRSMQFLGVIDRNEILFVDSQAYAHDGELGGRLICIAWQLRPAADRSSLTEPVPCDIVFYEAGLQETQLRLASEFGRAMQDLDRRYRDAVLPARGARILPFAPRP